MAATLLAPSHFFFPAHRLFFAPKPHHHRLRILHRRCFLAAISASSLNQTRVTGRKKARSNADLCDDLREFMAEVGLPEGHVPSCKELSQHGRQDLANIVRRRGYKIIKELLATSTATKVTESDVEGSLTGKQDRTNTEEVESADNGLDITHELANDEKDNSESRSLTELELSSVCEEQSGLVFSVTDTTNVLNGNISSSQLVHSTTEGTLRKISSTDQVASAGSADTDKEADAETRMNEDEAEVNRIKFMLHHKELELSHLKAQIEKDQQALSELQAKAESEINRTQKLLLDKDAELHAAEESLSGLKQVQIEYWGDGEAVEVAGSFNGWHRGIKLDLKPSSDSTDPGEPRKSRLWKSVLWLYPGIYEIKFIVDGKWMIDPMKEVVTRGTIQNNILQVDR